MAGNKERLERSKGKKNTVLKVNNLRHVINVNFKSLKKKEKENG